MGMGGFESRKSDSKQEKALQAGKPVKDPAQEAGKRQIERLSLPQRGGVCAQLKLGEECVSLCFVLKEVVLDNWTGTLN